MSQFSTPSGLWRQRGTEEYMAPELRGNQHTAYDEKVYVHRMHTCSGTVCNVSEVTIFWKFLSTRVI